MEESRTTFLKLCLADSLIVLMKDKPYQDIAVTDICAKAGVSRSTFYRYLDKDNPKEQLLSFRLMQGWCEFRMNAGNSGKRNRDLLNYVYSIRNVVLLLADRGLIALVLEAFKIIVYPGTSEDKTSSYGLAFYSYGFCGIVHQWILYRFDETPEEVEKRLAVSMENGKN